MQAVKFFRTLICLGLLAAVLFAALLPGAAGLAQTGGPGDLPAGPFTEEARLAPGADPALMNEIARLTASGGPNDHAGFSVALSSDGNTALVGAYSVDIDAKADCGAAYVFTRTGTTWNQTAQLIAADGASGDQFGIAVALSAGGHTALVGADLKDAPGKENQGAAFVFVWDGNAWSQQQKIMVEGAVADARLGWAVALSDSGDTAVVGAYNDNVGGFAGQGAAYVFERSGTSWANTKTFTVDVSGAYLGFSVAVSGDGNKVLLGAPAHDDGGKNDVGRAFLFARKDGGWVSEATLAAQDGAAEDWFGRSVALDLDGNVALVGASNADVDSQGNRGAAYLFSGNALQWKQTKKFVDAGGKVNDFMGVSVSLSDTGETAIIGSFKADYDACTDCGKALVFRKAGTGWAEPATLTASFGLGAQLGVGVAVSGDGSTVLSGANMADYRTLIDTGITLVHAFDGQGWPWQATLGHIKSGQPDFGDDIALSGDGNTAIVGLPTADINGKDGVGAVYVYIRSGSAWVQEALLAASDGLVRDWFGSSVALSENGSTALIGAYGVNVAGKNNQGAAYVFTRSGGVWTQQAKLTAADGSAEDYFGHSVALSANGGLGVVGANYADVDGHADQGAAYIFSRSGSSWSEQAKLAAGGANDYASQDLAMSGDGSTVLLGAPQATVGANVKQGKVHVFAYNGSTYALQTTLTDPLGQEKDWFGVGQALSYDGNTALISAYGVDINANVNQGAAFVYKRTGNAWARSATLTAGEAGEELGEQVALSADGKLALVGSPYTNTPPSQGVAYVFAFKNQEWSLQKKLAASNGAADDCFGKDVALSSDGSRALVGANRVDWGGVSATGMIYVFQGPFSGHQIFLPLARRN